MADYQERVGSIAKASAGFGMEGGRATIEYQMPWADVKDFCQECLGSVKLNGNRLRRVLPKAHPVFPWLYASSISTVEGYQFETTSMETEELEAPAIDYYAQYAYARVVVEFTPRPYSLFADDSIGTGACIYMDPTGAMLGPVAVYEYWRFVSFKSKPAMEYLTAQHGQFRMAGTIPDGVAFPGQVRIIKKSKALTITWHQVPYAVSEGPNIFNGLGMVNQQKWWGYEAGTLLFLGIDTTEPVPPPFPDLETDPDLGTTVPSADKVVNIVFNMLYCEPVMGARVTPPLTNYIAYGHNAQPWFKDGKYYYATTGTTIDQDPANGVPPYFSYPFDLLFTPSANA